MRVDEAVPATDDEASIFLLKVSLPQVDRLRITFGLAAHLFNDKTKTVLTLIATKLQLYTSSNQLIYPFSPLPTHTQIIYFLSVQLIV